MAAAEILREEPPMKNTPRPLRRAVSMAESIARHTAVSDVPIEQVVSSWAGQKGVEFIEQVLSYSPYNLLNEKEKERLQILAAGVVADAWLSSLGYGTSYVGDRRYAFWNVDYQM